jgi:hypothetical protein
MDRESFGEAFRKQDASDLFYESDLEKSIEATFDKIRDADEIIECLVDLLIAERRKNLGRRGPYAHASKSLVMDRSPHLKAILDRVAEWKRWDGPQKTAASRPMKLIECRALTATEESVCRVEVEPDSHLGASSVASPIRYLLLKRLRTSRAVSEVRTSNGCGVPAGSVIAGTDLVVRIRDGSRTIDWSVKCVSRFHLRSLIVEIHDVLISLSKHKGVRRVTITQGHRDAGDVQGVGPVHPNSNAGHWEAATESAGYDREDIRNCVELLKDPSPDPDASSVMALSEKIGSLFVTSLAPDIPIRFQLSDSKYRRPEFFGPLGMDPTVRWFTCKLSRQLRKYRGYPSRPGYPELPCLPWTDCSFGALMCKISRAVDRIESAIASEHVCGTKRSLDDLNEVIAACVYTAAYIIMLADSARVKLVEEGGEDHDDDNEPH